LGGVVVPEIPSYYAHTIVSLVAFVAIILGEFLTWRAVKGGNRSVWGRYALFSSLCGILSVITPLIFLLTLFGPYEGPTERMFSVVALVWIEVTGLKLRSLDILQRSTG
jgi:hypothetical protein